jgi:anti-sigma B factor antagonist
MCIRYFLISHETVNKFLRSFYTLVKVYVAQAVKIETMDEISTCMLAEENFLSSEQQEGTLKMRLKTSTTADLAVIHCEGRLVWGIEAALLVDEIEGLLSQSRQIVIDLSGVQQIDASGLGELVSVAAAAQASGCAIKLAVPGDFIRRVLTLTRLTSVFAIYPTVDAAILAFGQSAAAASVGF